MAGQCRSPKRAEWPVLIVSPTPQPRRVVSSGELVVHLIDSAGDGSHKAASRLPQTLAHERRSGSKPAVRPLGRVQGTLRSKSFWERPVLHQAEPVRQKPSRPARTVETHEFDRVIARCDLRCDDTGETTNPHLHGTPKEQGRLGYVVFCWEAGHERHGTEPGGREQVVGHANGLDDPLSVRLRLPRAGQPGPQVLCYVRSQKARARRVRDGRLDTLSEPRCWWASLRPSWVMHWTTTVGAD